MTRLWSAVVLLRRRLAGAEENGRFRYFRL